MSTTTSASSGRGKKAVKPMHNPNAKAVSYKEIEERANAVDRAIDDRLLQCRLLTIDLQEEERVRQSREAAILKRDLEEIAANGGNVLSIKTITPSIINLSFMYLLHKTSIDNAFEFYPVEAYNENFNIDCDLPTLFQVFGESLFPGIHSNDEIRRVAKDLFNASMEFHHGEGNISSNFYYNDYDRVFSVTPKGNLWFDNRCNRFVVNLISAHCKKIDKIGLEKVRANVERKQQQELEERRTKTRRRWEEDLEEDERTKQEMEERERRSLEEDEEIDKSLRPVQEHEELQKELQKGVQLQEELENVTRFREELVKLEKAKSLESVKEEYEVEAEEDGNIIYGWIQTLDGDSEEE